MISLLNILNFLSISLSFAFQILLIRLFGAVLQTDVYYLTVGIIHFLNVLFIGFLTDLFTPVYSEIKVKSQDDSRRFIGAVLILAFLIASLISISLYFSAPYLVKLFASGFSVDNIVVAAKFLRLFSITIVFAALNSIIITVLTANLYMSVVYSTALITPSFNLLALIFFGKQYGIEPVIFAMILGSASTFVVLFSYFAKKVEFKVSNPFSNQDVRSLLKQNFPLRAGHLINRLKGLITTNALSYFPVGYISLFSYADKIINTILQITNSPILNLLYVKTSNLLAMKNQAEIKSILVPTIKCNMLLFLCVLLATLVVFKKAFGILFLNKLSADEINTMYYLFLTLIPYYMTLSFELPFTNVTIAMKECLRILKIGIISLILYTGCLLAGIKHLGIYAIPAAMLCAQWYNTMAYIKFVNGMLNVFDPESVKTFCLFGGLGISLVSLNLILNGDLILQLSLNLLMAGLWLLLIGKDVVDILSFLIRKGEIK